MSNKKWNIKLESTIETEDRNDFEILGDNIYTLNGERNRKFKEEHYANMIENYPNNEGVKWQVQKSRETFESFANNVELVCQGLGPFSIHLNVEYDIEYPSDWTVDDVVSWIHTIRDIDTSYIQDYVELITKGTHDEMVYANFRALLDTLKENKVLTITDGIKTYTYDKSIQYDWVITDNNTITN